MMKYEIYIFTQQKTPSFYKDAIAEYTKRLGRYCKIKCEFIKKVKAWEKIINEYQKEEKVFVFPGKDSITSEQLSLQMSAWESSGQGRIVFFIPDGIEFVPDKGEKSLNLSDFTMNTAMTAMVLHEQIYRGYRIMHNHPYHK